MLVGVDVLVGVGVAPFVGVDVLVGAGVDGGVGQEKLKSQTVPGNGANMVINALVGVSADFVKPATPLPGPDTLGYPNAFSCSL